VTALLDVRDLSVTFRTEHGPLRAVDGVSFQVARGETLAIVGESGSGKSVTALALLGLLGDAAVLEGAGVMFDGCDLTTLAPDAMRRIRGNRIAMVFQEPMSSLNPVLTVGEQIAEPLRLHKKMSKAEALRVAVSLLEKVSIPDAAARLKEYPHQFSGGMRQRVLIAMALACQPALIVADEPTTALDVTVQAQILDLLGQLTRESGAALILITHDLGVVARYADRVAVMYAGRIVESAPVRDLFRDPRHPYTRGLMSSSPRLASEAKTAMATIAGQPPDLAHLPPGCSFAPRCPDAHVRCMSERPMLKVVSPGRVSACHGPA
jgi:oligopeptide transport system ATP-binding protein